MNPLRAICVVYAILLVGCSVYKPTKGGASNVALGPDTAVLTQPENPATESRQKVTKTVSRKIAKAPSAGRNRSVRVERTDQKAAMPVEAPGAPAAPSLAESPVPIAPTNELEEVLETTVVETVIGPAQKDTSAEIRARIEAMRPMQIVGVVFIVAAIAMFWPKVRLIAACSREMQVATAVAGGALVYGPQLLAGNEWLVILGVAAYYIISRHSYTKAQADAKDDASGPSS